MEAATGVEPVIKVLQTSALPLGYVAASGYEYIKFGTHYPLLQQLINHSVCLRSIAAAKKVEVIENMVKVIESLALAVS